MNVTVKRFFGFFYLCGIGGLESSSAGPWTNDFSSASFCTAHIVQPERHKKQLLKHKNHNQQAQMFIVCVHVKRRHSWLAKSWFWVFSHQAQLHNSLFVVRQYTQRRKSVYWFISSYFVIKINSNFLAPFLHACKLTANCCVMVARQQQLCTVKKNENAPI